MSQIERDALHTVKLPYGIKAYVVPDTDPQSPDDWDQVGTLRHADSWRFGERCSAEVVEELAQEIDSGKLIGLKLRIDDYGSRGALIHESEDCNAVLYCDRAKALDEFGDAADKLSEVFAKALTEACKERTLKCLRGELESWNDYLQGNVYGVVVHDRYGKVLDSVWGYYGYDYAKEEAERQGKWEVKYERSRRREAKRRARHEANERAYWEARDVVTV